MRTFRGPAIVVSRGLRPSLCLTVQEPILPLRLEGVNRALHCQSTRPRSFLPKRPAHVPNHDQLHYQEKEDAQKRSVRRETGCLVGFDNFHL